MEEKFDSERFNSSVSPVATELRQALLKLSDYEKNMIYEVRLRSNRPLILVTGTGCRFLGLDGKLKKDCSDDVIMCTTENVTDTFNRLCCFSVHAHLSGIVKGYITMQGGHRAGVTGTAVTDSMGNITSLRDVSGINIRVSREIKGCADKIISEVYKDNLKSVIIAGPPASGKTTVLRDIIRQLSSGKTLYKVAVVDERQEIASVNCGIPQNDVGLNTDILDSYPKGQAVMLALKTLSPDIIAIDEVGEEEEIRQIALGVNSGVRFIVTVHASDYNELIHRPQISKLIETYSFEKLVMLSKSPVGSVADIYDTKELRDEIIRRRNNLDVFGSFGYDDCDTA